MVLNIFVQTEKYIVLNIFVQTEKCCSEYICTDRNILF